MDGRVGGPDGAALDSVSSILVFVLRPPVLGLLTDEVRGGGVGGGLWRMLFLRDGPRDSVDRVSFSTTAEAPDCGGGGGRGIDGSFGNLDRGGLGTGTVFDFFSGVRMP